MARPFVGGVRKSRCEVKQKNGDTYVYDRKLEYNPKTGKTEDKGRELIGKIPRDSKTGEIVPTRAKKKPAQKKKAVNVTAGLKPITEKIGLRLLLEWAAKESGIREDLHASFPTGEAQKIDTIAQFWTANQGSRLSKMEIWQLTHSCPYPEEISKVVYHNLFEYIGTHRGCEENYFKSRSNRCGKFEALALDSTTISSYSENIHSNRLGFNKAGDGLNAVKLTTIYALNAKQPIAFLKQPGNIADVAAIARSLSELTWLDMDSIQVVTDKGYYSQNNIHQFLQKHVKFLTAVNNDLRWVKEQLIAHRADLDDVQNSCPWDVSIQAVTVPLKQTFEWKKPGKQQETISKPYRLYLHLYRNRDRELIAFKELSQTVRKLKDQIENGETEFNELAQAQIKKYLILSRKGRGGKLKVSINTKAFNEAIQWDGYFALLSNKATDPFVALANYRLREKIEEAFKDTKNRFDGHRTRVWSDETLQGRLFCQFVGLGYLYFIRNRIELVVDKLEEIVTTRSRDGVNIKEEDFKQYQDLLKWIKQHSLQQILEWLDCIEKTSFINNSGQVVGTISGATKRDSLFFEFLGVSGLEIKPPAKMIKKT